ncbi:MAG: hypothetical protein HY920_01825 [Elusimicrobia bacterium]|nr:hypothetical protein [Elusimicrobiota bacterium]
MDLGEVNPSNTKRHPWELARRESLRELIYPFKGDITFADIGAGDLFFTKMLKNLSTKPIYAVDINYRNMSSSEAIIQSKEISSLANNSIDYMILLDVLEHAKDDKKFIARLKLKLREESRILITVPAFQFLFSEHDVFLHHFKRYSKKELGEIMKSQGFLCEESFYFFFFPFFLRLLEKNILAKRKRYGIGNWRLARGNFITILGVFLLRLDFKLCRYLQKIGLYIPGLSLCFLGKKKSV